MKRNWELLIVDDVPDVHMVTGLALKRRSWRGRRFALTSAYSAKEAKEVLNTHPNKFHCAVVDVVMESDHAGLDLCSYIRENCPRSIRLILRTGQPGAAPKESVLAQYDIDHYLAKADADEDKIFTLVRASVRASLDVGLMLAIQNQMHKFTESLRDAGTIKDVIAIFGEGLAFIADLYSVGVGFCSNLGADPAQLHDLSITTGDVDRDAVVKVLTDAYAQSAPLGELLPASEVGAADNGHVMIVPVLDPNVTEGRIVNVPGERSESQSTTLRQRLKRLLTRPAPSSRTVHAGFYIKPEADSEPRLVDFCTDLSLLLDSWKLTYSTLCLQQDVAEMRAAAEVAKAFR